MYEEEKQELQEKLEDKFKIIEFCGEGDFGRVWQAECLESIDGIEAGTSCAVKEPTGSEKEVNILFEDQAKARIVHPNVVQIYGVVRVGYDNILIMELCKGNLKSRLRNHRFTLEESVEMFKGICKGLQVLHERGLYHRDINVSNVLIGLDGAPKVGDLGLIKKSPNKSSQLKGAFNYIPLEQCVRNEETGMFDADSRADIFSAGVVLYELLSGTLPFIQARDWPEAIALKGNMDYVNGLSIDSVDERTMQVIRRCLQKEWNLGNFARQLKEKENRYPNPHEYRYQTMQEVLDDLEGKPQNHLAYLDSMHREVLRYIEHKKVYGITALSDIRDIRNKISTLAFYKAIHALHDNSDVEAMRLEIRESGKTVREADFNKIWAWGTPDKSYDETRRLILIDEAGLKPEVIASHQALRKQWEIYMKQNPEKWEMYKKACDVLHWDFGADNIWPNTPSFGRDNNAFFDRLEDV